AARRAVARVEVEHDMLLALERRQVDGLHISVGERERRRGLSGLQHVATILCQIIFHLPSARARLSRDSYRNGAAYNRRDEAARRLDAARVSSRVLAEAPASRARRIAAAR